jgi:hypothetical protein
VVGGLQGGGGCRDGGVQRGSVGLRCVSATAGSVPHLTPHHHPHPLNPPPAHQPYTPLSSVLSRVHTRSCGRYKILRSLGSGTYGKVGPFPHPFSPFPGYMNLPELPGQVDPVHGRRSQALEPPTPPCGNPPAAETRVAALLWAGRCGSASRGGRAVRERPQ